MFNYTHICIMKTSNGIMMVADGSAMPDRYILYATGNYYGEYGEIIPCTAFVPYHIYR